MPLIQFHVAIYNTYIEGLYSQKKNKTLKTSKLKTKKIKSIMEEEIPSGTK